MPHGILKMVRQDAGAVDDLFRQKSLQEIHGILQNTRAQVEAKKTELRELVGDHYQSVLESSDHIRAMSDCAVQVAHGAEKLESLIATMRELAGKPPQPDNQWEPETEFSLCEHVMELLEMPEKVRGLVAELNFVKAAKAALVDAPALHSQVQERLRVESLPGFDPQGLIAQQAAAFRSLPRQVAGGCVDAFAAAELTPAAAAEAFVAHLVLDEAAASSLLRRFIACRSSLLRDILEGSGAAFGGDSQEGLLQRLSAAAMAFEGTIVVASSLCTPGAGGAAPPLLASALNRLDTSNEILKQKAAMLVAVFRSGGSMATELAPLGLQFVKSWAPEVGRDSGKTFSGHFEALIASSSPTTCSELGQLQRLFTQRLTAFRRALAESVGDGRDWPALWKGACGLFCPGKGVCPDSLSALQRCVEQSCAQLVKERLRELKLVLVEPGELPEEEVDESRRAEQLTEMRSQCQAHISSFDEELGSFLDDVAQISEIQIPSTVTFAMMEGLELQLATALQALQSSMPRVAPLWPATDLQVPSWKVQRAAINAAIALEVLLAAVNPNCERGSTRLGTALKDASTSGHAALSEKATAITNLLQQHIEEVNCTWARVVVGAGEPVARLGSFWKLADDEVGPACGWGSAKFPAREGEAKSVAVPIQSSAFVFERLTFASQSLASAKLKGSTPAAAALKAALAECFAAAYEDKPSDLARLKRSGMSHLLQWLFDLNFLHLALAAAASPGAAALQMLRGLLAQTESIAFSDPVDRVLYQDLLKASVNNHVQETKVLLAPFFTHKPSFVSQAQPGVGRSNSNSKPGLTAPGITGDENEGFELQTSYTAPLRPVLPRFPLLPVAMNVNARSDLDRLRLEPRAKAEIRPQSLMQQAGGLVGGLGGLSSRFGFGKGEDAKDAKAMNV